MWLCVVSVLITYVSSTSGVHETPSYPSDASPNLKDGDTFDFIVAGAGASGSAVAGRLSACGARVLLLEAGSDPDIRSRVPSLALSLLGSEFDWAFETIPNGKSCLSAKNKQCVFNRGKILGGSTSINSMMYVRGNSRDYDSWDVKGWTWNDLLPYFRKFENLTILNQLPKSSLPYHNTRGPMQVEFAADSQNTWHQLTLDAYSYLDFPYNYDLNAESQIGVTRLVSYVSDGERQTSARSYLSPATNRSNLLVAKEAQVTKVILDDYQNVALGVTAIIAKTIKVNIYATKEVILSTGSLNTPQILMLSGIGPADHLNNMSIPVRADLPVGEGLQDHVLPLLFVQVPSGYGSNFPNDSDLLQQWLLTQDGPYASTGMSDVTAFINIDCYNFEKRFLAYTGEDCEWPTVYFNHIYLEQNAATEQSDVISKASNLNSDLMKQLQAVNADSALLVVSPSLLNPKSRGWVKLKTNNPLDPPNIFPNYLDVDDDARDLTRGIKIVEDLMDTEPFKSRGAKIWWPNLDGCATLQIGTDAYRECYVRHMTFSDYHNLCTTALGRVVDEELKVKGVERLRVADGGVVPELPRGNTAALCIAIGEKAADLIKAKHNLKCRKKKNKKSRKH